MPEVLVQSVFERDMLSQNVEDFGAHDHQWEPKIISLEKNEDRNHQRGNGKAMMTPRAAVKMHCCAELRPSVGPPKGSTTQSGT